MLLEKLKRKLEHISEMYGCQLTYNDEHQEGIVLSELDEETKERKWLIAFNYKGDDGLSIHSFGLNYFDHHIRNFPLSDIDKDVVDLSDHAATHELLDVKRSEINFISDDTIDVIKLIVEKDASGLHVELVESRNRIDFSVLLSDYFNCNIPAIDEDGYQHYLLKYDGEKWKAQTPEIGTWTQETLHNAFNIDYSYLDQLIHLTFYNRDAQLVQQSNVFVKAIEMSEDGLIFQSVKGNKKIKLVMDTRISMSVIY